MKLQFFSDIHLEFGPFEIPQTEADVVIAAGDVGLGSEGVDWLQNARKPVIYIAGNREFYTHEMLGTVDDITAAAKDTNVHFLDNAAVEIDGVRFLGSTLWTNFDGGRKEFMAAAQRSMNDYVQISHDTSDLTPEILLDINTRSRKWLTDALNEPFNGKTVVVTHHAPTYTSWSDTERAIYKYAYCNDLTELIEASRIALWVHGHIHKTCDYESHGVRVVCNPRGYNGYQRIRGFDAAKVIEI